MHYDGFISYSHAADGELAPSLQAALQRIAKPWYRRRALEVFRDETGLAVDPHLWGAITKALDDSEWFLLLTSPRAATSSWVNREVEHWKANRPIDRILPVVTEGHWEWDPATGDFTLDSDAVPPALRGVFSAEPRHLDLRWAREERQLNLRNGRFRDAVAELAAPLHGRTKDDIEGEDVRQHRRTRRLAWGAASALAVLAVAAIIGAGLAVRNARQADERRVEAEAQRLVAQSQSELAQPDLAFLLAAHAHRLDATVQTRGAVLNSVANLPEYTRRIDAATPTRAVAHDDGTDRAWIGSGDGTIALHRYSDGERLAERRDLFSEEILAIVPFGDGDAVRVAATDAEVVAVLDPDLDTVVERPGPDGGAFSLAVDPSSERLAVGSGVGEVAVWESEATEPEQTFTVTEDAVVYAVAWLDETTLVTADTTGEVKAWDLDDTDEPKWTQSEIVLSGIWVQALAVVPDGPLVTGATDGSVGFLDPQDGTVTDAGVQRVHAAEVMDLAYTGGAPETGTVASIGEDGLLVFWNHETGALPELFPPLRVDQAGGNSVAWDPSNPLQGLVGGVDGGTLFLDYGDDQRRPIARPTDEWTDAASVALSDDGRRLAVATTEPKLTITDAADPSDSDSSIDLDALVESMSFTPDGEYVIAGLGDGSLVVWDGEGRPETRNVQPGWPLARVAVSDDGTRVAAGALDLEAETAEPSTVRVWRFEEGELTADGQITAPPFGFGLAFSPDGARLIMGGVQSFAVHDLARGATEEFDLPPGGSRSLAAHPDGDRVAIGLMDGPIRTFDLDTGEPVGDDLRNLGRVTDMAFDESGQVLVTVAEDNRFTLWDVESGRSYAEQPIAATSGRTDGVPLSLTLGLADEVAVTAGIGDGAVVFWSLVVADWVEEGCALHQRELTEAEADRFDLEDAPPICG